MGAPCRRRGALAACRTAAGVPSWAADFRTVRGKCLRRRCGSRWAVIRLSLDFRDDTRIDRIATLECALCGRTWRRIRPDQSPASPAGYQAVRLTLLLPAKARRWRSRGRWHREGDDAEVLTEADLADLDEAARDHRARATAKARAKAHAAEKRAEADREAIARTDALLAHLHEMDAARAAEEAAADARS